MKRRLHILLSAAGLTLALMGCQQPKADAPNPLSIDAREYDRMYDAAIVVLRDHGFRVTRQDYRFGRVTAGPKGSATALEPWKGDNSNLHLAGVSTFSDIQRRAMIYIDPIAGDAEQDAETADAPTAPTETATDGYTLRVEVILERKQQPTRRLTGSHSKNVFSDLREVPAELKQQGIQASYWQQIGRDAQLEQRLLQAIVRQAVFGK